MLNASVDLALHSMAEEKTSVHQVQPGEGKDFLLYVLVKQSNQESTMLLN